VRDGQPDPRRGIRRQALSLALAVAPFGLAFGVASTQAGLSWVQASGFSVLVFAGSAQFAAVEILGRGGSAAAAIAAGLLLNVRSLAFGLVMAPSLEGPRWKRAVWSQLMIDESTAVGSAQASPRWRRYGFVYTGVAIFIAWNISTAVGAVALGSSSTLITRAGIDAAVPAAFLALLWPRLASPDQRAVALGGAVAALALVPVAPAGVPVIAGGAVALAVAAWERR